MVTSQNFVHRLQNSIIPSDSERVLRIDAQ